jgi:hypothetical protein
MMVQQLQFHSESKGGLLVCRARRCLPRHVLPAEWFDGEILARPDHRGLACKLVSSLPRISLFAQDDAVICREKLRKAATRTDEADGDDGLGTEKQATGLWNGSRVSVLATCVR